MSLPLQEKISGKKSLRRVSDFLLIFLLLSLIFYRLLHLKEQGPVWVLALICETWFIFTSLLGLNIQWSAVNRKTYPDRLLERVKNLPPVDIFVTTADSTLEPPIITVNTVLSLLAVDYPAHKLACYVSDDGGSPITFYSLVEASKFAKIWVPFCKKYGVQVRAPSMYFTKKPEEVPHGHSSDVFMQEWENMESHYNELCKKIEAAVKKSVPCNLTNEFGADFYDFEHGNHPSMVKVILENKKSDGDEPPHLVYVAREKRPGQPHHFKAGAMNVLTRVSGVMTNAPFLLNVDCDMFVNNPQVVLHAMCLLLGAEERESGFVQFPQMFYGSLKDDPFGSSLVVSQEVTVRGFDGIQGPMYGGTGCFHRRKIIFGLPPDYDEIKGTKLSPKNGDFGKALLQKFGNSATLAESVTQITTSGATKDELHKLSDYIDAAHEVASCRYELNTHWGNEVGWVYGSTTEDVLTGIKIHSMGWASAYCTPVPPAFLGCAPQGGTTNLVQVKRWATGLLEILVGSNSPLIATFSKKLRFRQCLVYLFLNIWAVRSLPEVCYAVLPAYCILTNSSLWPKMSEPAILIPATLFVHYNFRTLMDYLLLRLPVRAWWNTQRMEKISATACLFSILAVLLKLLGLEETIFEVTRKDQNETNSEPVADVGKFTFDASPIFVPGVTLVFLHMAALVVGLSRVQAMAHGEAGPGPGEMLCSVWVLLYFIPFIKGLFRRGSYGIPWTTIFKAGVLAFLFMQI
ncbi:hypothetical protein AAC387_Pa07g2182 [Persea americana]